MTPSPHRGIDLSHHQDHVDFGTVKASGVEFVALKATEGAGYTDPTFADRWARARLVGFRHLVAYHFFRPLEDARVQAFHFAHVVGALRDNELVALDVERVPDASQDWTHRSALASRNYVIAAREALLSVGVPPERILLYGSPEWLRGTFGARLKDLTVMPLWAAHYAASVGDVSPWPEATVWQNSERGAVPGAGSPGEIDTDLWLKPGAW